MSSPKQDKMGGWGGGGGNHSRTHHGQTSEKERQIKTSLKQLKRNNALPIKEKQFNLKCISHQKLWKPEGNSTLFKC